MFCKRCGSPLTGNDFVCSQCGMMMNSEQIKRKKNLLAGNKNQRVDLISERYGFKKMIFQKREEQTSKYIGILFVIAVILIIIIVGFLVYFS